MSAAASGQRQVSREQEGRSARTSEKNRAGEVTSPGQDFIEHVKAFSKEHPEVAALWCFGIGFIVAWKIKPW